MPTKRKLPPGDVLVDLVLFELIKVGGQYTNRSASPVSALLERTWPGAPQQARHLARQAMVRQEDGRFEIFYEQVGERRRIVTLSIKGEVDPDERERLKAVRAAFIAEYHPSFLAKPGGLSPEQEQVFDGLVTCVGELERKLAAAEAGRREEARLHQAQEDVRDQIIAELEQRIRGLGGDPTHADPVELVSVWLIERLHSTEVAQ